MVRAASSGFVAFLEIGLEKARREQETARLDDVPDGAAAERAVDAAGSRPVRRPPPRLTGLFGSGM
jgi:hypothetical protein